MAKQLNQYFLSNSNTMKLGNHDYQIVNLLVWLCISGGQTRHNKILIFEIKFGFEGHGQSLPKNNRDLNQRVVHMYALV